MFPLRGPTSLSGKCPSESILERHRWAVPFLVTSDKEDHAGQPKDSSLQINAQVSLASKQLTTDSCFLPPASRSLPPNFLVVSPLVRFSIRRSFNK
jgi:hypothetical protein